MSGTRLRSYREDAEETRALLHEDIGLDTLHSKKREDDYSPSSQPRDQTIETDIQPSDTLLSLSLKYNVPLAELKRVNNFIRDDEFYALKRIKIPVRPTSLLTELLPGDHCNELSNNNGWFVESKESPTSFGSSVVSSGGQSSPELGSSPFSELASRDLGDSCTPPTVGNLLGVEELAPVVFHESRDKKKVKKLFREMDRDLDRIKEKQTELETTDQIPIDELPSNSSRGFPLKASQIPTDDPGCSNRVLGCWCVVVGVLIIIVFCILVSLMKIQHDNLHAKDIEELEKITSNISAKKS